jgi:hypothetical protein
MAHLLSWMVRIAASAGAPPLQSGEWFFLLAIHTKCLLYCRQREGGQEGRKVKSPFPWVVSLSVGMGPPPPPPSPCILPCIRSKPTHWRLFDPGISTPWPRRPGTPDFLLYWPLVPRLDIRSESGPGFFFLPSLSLTHAHTFPFPLTGFNTCQSCLLVRLFSSFLQSHSL